MGGKGGGGSSGGDPAKMKLLQDQHVDMGKYLDPVGQRDYRKAVYANQMWDPAYDPSTGQLRNQPAPPAPAPAPAPAAAPPPPPAPPPPDPGPPDPLGPPIDPGGAIDQPNAANNGLGGDLGGAVLNPPQYWVGGLNNNAMATSQSGRGQGAMKTTE